MFKLLIGAKLLILGFFKLKLLNFIYPTDYNSKSDSFPNTLKNN